MRPINSCHHRTSENSHLILIVQRCLWAKGQETQPKLPSKLQVATRLVLSSIIVVCHLSLRLIENRRMLSIMASTSAELAAAKHLCSACRNRRCCLSEGGPNGVQTRCCLALIHQLLGEVAHHRSSKSARGRMWHPKTWDDVGWDLALMPV